MIHHAKLKASTAVIAAGAIAALAACTPYETKPLDNPEMPMAVLTVADVSALELQGVLVTIDAVDGEPTWDGQRVALYPGKRSIRVAAALTAQVAQRGVRVPLRTCDTTLAFVAEGGQRYRLVAENPWGNGASLGIVDAADRAVTASKPCSPRSGGAPGPTPRTEGVREPARPS